MCCNELSSLIYTTIVGGGGGWGVINCPNDLIQRMDVVISYIQGCCSQLVSLF